MFTITPENRIAVETVLLILCSLAAAFIARPAQQTEDRKVESHELVTGD